MKTALKIAGAIAITATIGGTSALWVVIDHHAPLPAKTATENAIGNRPAGWFVNEAAGDLAWRYMVQCHKLGPPHCETKPQAKPRPKAPANDANGNRSKPRAVANPKSA